MDARRAGNGALAGAAAAAVWALQQPLDKRLFSSRYDDLELLGKFVTPGPRWPLVGTVLHLENGAMFGALYALARVRLPGPWAAHALGAALVEHAGLWPLTGVVDRRHPARRELPRLAGNRRAFAQATWRHLLFGLVLGALESRLNRPRRLAPAEVPAASNGHGRLEASLAPA
jgi:hypothetical protein